MIQTKRVTRLCLFFIVSVFTFHVNANEAEFNRIFSLIYNQQYAEAKTELEFSTGKLDILESNMLHLDLYWWKAINNNNPGDYQKLEQILAEGLKKYGKSQSENSFNKLIFMSYSLRFSAFKNRYISLIGNMFKINQIIENLDTCALSQRNREIFNIYKAIFYICKSRFIIFNSELIKKSITTLEKGTNSSDLPVKTVSSYFLAKVYLEIEKSPDKAKKHFKWLLDLYPGNKIFQTYYDLCTESGGPNKKYSAFPVVS
jgi:hypothetical protein